MDDVEIIRNLTTRLATLEGSQVVHVGPTIYTPTLTGMAVGTGGSAYNSATWQLDGRLMTVSGSLTFGTSGATFPVAGITVSLPSGFQIDSTYGTLRDFGLVQFVDAGVSSYTGVVNYATTTTVQLIALDVTTYSYLRRTATGTTVPFTWVAGDSIGYQFTTPVTRT